MASSSAPLLFPSLEEIRAWNTEQVIAHFESVDHDSDLLDSDKNILRDNRIKGKHLPDLTEEGLRADGIPRGAAIFIRKEIDRLLGRPPPGK